MVTGFHQSSLPQPTGIGEDVIGSCTVLPEGNRYPELIGSLQYLSNTTRPDISQAVGVLSRYRGKPTTSHWNGGIHVQRYLAGTADMGIIYGQGSSNELTCYVDSDFAGDLDTRKSTTGYAFILNGSVVSWASRKQPSVSTSTVEAEYIAASSAVKEAMWLGNMMQELGFPIPKITLFLDNEG